MSPDIIKRRIIDLIDTVPDEKLGALFEFVKFLQYNDEDDAELMILADEAEKNADFVDFEDVVKGLGYELGELRD